MATVNKGAKKKFVERGVLVVLIIVVVITIFVPVGVLIEKFLDIEGRAGSESFNYKESCGNITKEMVSI